MHRLLVFGGRDFNDFMWMEHCLREFTNTIGPISVVIHGRAKGADEMADYFAKKVLKVKIFDIAANWSDICTKGALIKYASNGKPYNARAGIWRNQELIDRGKPTYGMGFKGGAGTADMAKRLIAANIPIFNAGYV